MGCFDFHLFPPKSKPGRKKGKGSEMCCIGKREEAEFLITEVEITEQKLNNLDKVQLSEEYFVQVYNEISNE